MGRATDECDETSTMDRPPPTTTTNNNNNNGKADEGEGGEAAPANDDAETAAAFSSDETQIGSADDESAKRKRRPVADAKPAQDKPNKPSQQSEAEDSAESASPKVPPLKIVIPSQPDADANKGCPKSKGGLPAQRVLRSHRTSSTGEDAAAAYIHPRKRKIKQAKEPHVQPPSEPSTSTGCSGEQKAAPQNPYQQAIAVKKQIDRRLKGLFPVQPKPPQGFDDYLMNRRTYVLDGNVRQQRQEPPQSLAQQLRDTFVEQEDDRHRLRVQHLVEKEKLVLAVEQEILRVHGRAARALANQPQPFSACAVLLERDAHGVLTPEQEEKERNAQRSRYNGRLFLSWLQDVDDKWEKIKEAMIRRHHTEAQSLYATQSMRWTWRLRELGLADAAKPIDPAHVPKVNVSDDFDLLPT